MIAFDKEKEAYQNFPLDRISNEKLSSQMLSGDSSFNSKEHFSNVIGVSVPQEGKVENIMFKVVKPRGYYVNTKPWHHSQILLDDQENALYFQIRIIPNLEFWSKVMEHVEDIEILEPEHLRDEFLKKVKAVYQRVITIQK